jgi:amino acid transporter
MKRRWKTRWPLFVLFGLLAATVVSLVTMTLWNALMPAIFGLPAIGAWQALGLLVLGRLLLGRPGGRPRFAHGWKSLKPEERERFREAMRRRCGGAEEPETAPRM